MNLLVSACLMGIPCRHDGTTATLEGLDGLRAKHTLIPVCPEVLGGLPTPREPCEIRRSWVYTKSGADVTAQFHRGGKEVLRLARLHGCTCALL